MTSDEIKAACKKVCDALPNDPVLAIDVLTVITASTISAYAELQTTDHVKDGKVFFETVYDYLTILVRED